MRAAMPVVLRSQGCEEWFAKINARLEAATTRLEDIASSTIELPQAVPVLAQTIASASTSGSPAPPPPVSAPEPPTPQPIPQEDLPESIERFDEFIEQSVVKYVKASNKLGGLVAEQAVKVLEGFKQQRRFLLISTKAKKPNLAGAEMATYQDLLKPINEALMAVNNIKESNRGSPVFGQLSAVAEGIMVLAWVTVDNRPYKHVEESLGSAQFFGNRVLKEHKDKDPDTVDWIKAFYQVFQDLTQYVKEEFPSGIPWNPKGEPAAAVAKTVAASGAAALPPPALPAAGGAPPPPPPPGPPPVLQIKEQKEETTSTSGLGSVFSELNKGADVTKGLRKVDRSQMTHKNPSLRASSTVPDHDGSARGKSPAPGKKPKPESMRIKKPPKKELDGNKWTIENYEKHAEPIEIEATISQSILISKCNHTTIIIKGKANAVTIENTQRLSLVVDSLVSTVDVVKSANFALQIMGAVPTIMLDQLDGATVYLSKESMATRLYSSKSAGINLNVIANGDEDYKELPLPGQFCTYFDEKKGELVNEIVEHAG
ncbi:adenylate cyclase associated N terminal-domain-containing protein [Pseudomassariella vexata]|uniref:Adenylyl cyclase-associated protein n=1 Tax=Pseudomassariella vexata TaxID=1141098 RepID=A0A1Y2E221_9PEZI|nr:adenylate cyclase associated N terminal-domain-containing protein [Pseudomassariella vexata]ORY65497.1 adenylate cyclase associated N terminal-domain-containing protein [Pseudomassariella vexata]